MVTDIRPRHTQLSYRSHRLHRWPASLRVCCRMSGTDVCKLPTLGTSSQPTATACLTITLRKLAFSKNMMTRYALILLTCLFVISGCASKHKAGGYYEDDGPADHIPADIEAIPNATPKIEPHRPANARPYKVLGKYYRPLPTNENYRETGIASWYGRKFHGKQTASGETYDMHAMTAAHRTLPLPSYARVTRVKTGKSIIVRINDRGPFHSNRIIDLSYVAAAKLGLIGPGSGRVTVEAITHDDIRQEAWRRDASE